MSKTINEIKTSLERINSRINDTKEWIKELEDRTIKITAKEQNLKKRMKIILDNLRDLWANIKCINI